MITGRRARSIRTPAAERAAGGRTCVHATVGRVRDTRPRAKRAAAARRTLIWRSMYARLMKLLVDEGRPDAARRTFAALRRQLLELGVDPEPETEALLNSSTHSVLVARAVRADRLELKIVDDDA